jgi:Tol biopolymer transport system component
MNLSWIIRQKTAVCLLGFWSVMSAPAASLQPVTTVDASVMSASGGGNSVDPVITPDGRYILFASTADNLALTSSNTAFAVQASPKLNVFLRDRTAGTTTLASVNLAGTGGGNGDSLPIAISTNGQFALFESSASNLMPGDTNNATDVFVRDLVNGTNLLVSVGLDGGFANGLSGESAMTPDGRYVAFASTASNLVVNDTNGIQDIFVRDLVNGVTTLASPGATGPGSSDSPQITPDGRYVAYLSTATNLVPDGITSGEVYVRDLTGAVTFLTSTNAHVLFTNSSVLPISYNHAISDDGQFVAFESSPNSMSGTLPGAIQRCNLVNGFTDVICTNAVALQNGFALSRNLDMSPDGRFIACVVSTNNGASSCVYLWDAQTETATLVSGDTNNAVPSGSFCNWPAVSSNGQYVVFFSTATNLTTNLVAAGEFHLYVRDVQAGATTLLDAAPNGVGYAKDFPDAAQLTPDGRFVAFDCSGGNLLTNDDHQSGDVFVSDLATNTIELVSVRQPSLPSQTSGGPGPSVIASVDASGRYVAFASASTGLVPNDTNTTSAVFVHDLLSGTNVLVSVAQNGMAAASGMATTPSISSDGRYVAFTSMATNLAAASYTVGVQNIFVHDLQAGTNALVSVGASGPAAGNGDSYSPVISANGHYVFFTSRASNLTSPGSSVNLFCRNLLTGHTYALNNSSGALLNLPADMTPDGHFIAFAGASANLYEWDAQAAAFVYTTNTGLISKLAVSPDGNRIAYLTSSGCYVTDRAANTNWLLASSLSGLHAGLQFSGDARFLVYSTPVALDSADTNGVADVYLYDFITRTNLLISQASPSGAANGASDYPAISPDGRFVAYRSTATNIVSGVTNGLPEVFLYDRQTGITTLLSVDHSGAADGNNRSLPPQFSGDSQTVVFESWAPDLADRDFNQADDLFAVKIATSNSTPVFVGQMVFAPVSRQSPTLTWPATPGTTYQVRFKNSLTDALWQPLNGNVWVDGSLGYATDLAPNASQRFYQVVGM